MLRAVLFPPELPLDLGFSLFERFELSRRLVEQFDDGISPPSHLNCVADLTDFQFKSFSSNGAVLFAGQRTDLSVLLLC